MKAFASSGRRRRTRAGFGRDEAAELCGRLAALAEAGLPASRCWMLLADGRGPVAEVAGRVAATVGVGGSAAAGLRAAAHPLDGDGVDALAWLAAVFEVIERSGAPSATVLDRIGAGLLAEIARADEREVAVAGPRATAAVLGWLPVGGLVLGPMLGVNPLGALLGGPPGWVCAGTGAALWGLGRWWSARLVARSAVPV